MQSRAKSIGILQENNGNYSSMRLMSLMMISSAITVALWTCSKPETLGNVGTQLVIILLGAGTVPKVVQKSLENTTAAPGESDIGR
jgi:hypothetical protein